MLDVELYIVNIWNEGYAAGYLDRSGKMTSKAGEAEMFNTSELAEVTAMRSGFKYYVFPCKLKVVGAVKVLTEDNECLDVIIND